MDKSISLLCFGNRSEIMKTLPQANRPRLSWEKSPDALIETIKQEPPAAITMSFKRPSPYLAITREIIQLTKGNIPIFLIVDSSVTEDDEFARLVARANVDYALTQSAPSERAQRLNILLRSRVAKDIPNDTWRLPGVLPVTTSLYDATSHRLNAQQIANLFGFTLRQLAGLLGVSPQSVHKTPDAVRLQSDLQVFERIARGLALVNNDKKGFRRWLNAPNSELENHSPQEVIQSGKAMIVANLVEDALLGQPA